VGEKVVYKVGGGPSIYTEKKKQNPSRRGEKCVLSKNGKKRKTNRENVAVKKTFNTGKLSAKGGQNILDRKHAEK